MRLLLTRPAAEAERTAAALRGRGHAPILAPLLAIELAADVEFGAGPWAAVLATSANAARAIAQHRRRDELRQMPAFTVGERSGEAMREAGFAEIISAAGDVNDLARLVAARVAPAARLLYLAGEERSGDLAGSLRARRYEVETVLVYRAVSADALPPQAATALAAGVDGVLHFSRRSAEAFIAAARNAGLLETALQGPVHFCLSARVAEPLAQAGAARLRIAAQPDEAALLELCG